MAGFASPLIASLCGTDPREPRMKAGLPLLRPRRWATACQRGWEWVWVSERLSVGTRQGGSPRWGEGWWTEWAGAKWLLKPLPALSSASSPMSRLTGLGTGC